VRRSARQPEHQHELRPVACEQRRQVAVDRGIAGGKDMRDEPHAGERGPAQPRQPLHQLSRRIERGSGKRAETGDEDVEHRYASL
jgi:hypothetical protein